ncbi:MULTISPECIES: DUF2501 domain-containing protein [unclassified Variovorax]|uniref:DUF2501 domain-containing protein n=1 Tax=unclassified Variovorax TaxID=663243 RepID=UPI001BD5E964|nr:MULTISPECIES: DUF2501 domain-containing protein [unclassified Variovorax]
MKSHIALIAGCLALSVAGTASAADLLGSLKSQAGNLSMPEMGSSTMGNAAGVLQYCVKNNYLAGGDASAVKDKLLGAVTGQQPQQEGYASGAKGLLQGTDGQSFDLKSVSGKLKTKACDYVLKNAKSLV